ncbi:hypothetical protein Syun_020684 [Stephania yunnanensis]|uniref:Uncharacterized protein n=1 Tax=Stephania yunnanensis TaxID=152371 RepID=A0AAP0NNG5_9MAGN
MSRTKRAYQVDHRGGLREVVDLVSKQVSQAQCDQLLWEIKQLLNKTRRIHTTLDI